MAQCPTILQLLGPVRELGAMPTQARPCSAKSTACPGKRGHGTRVVRFLGVLALFLATGILPVESAAGDEPAALERFEFCEVKMAVPVKIILFAANRQLAEQAATAAFARFEQLNGILSDYDPQSDLRQLCASAEAGHAAVAVGDDLWHVLSAAHRFSQRSQGAFDVTISPVIRLWRRARRRGQLPDVDRLAAARALVDYRLVKLDPATKSVTLGKPGMRLDLGGIAKGFAIDEALKVLKQHGITRALIDAGGDLGVADPPPNRDAWRIGVARLEIAGPPSQLLAVKNVGVASSGDAWQFVEIDGRRYSHIVDPRTGLGLTDHSSVTIVAADAMTADALASAVSVLGPKEGMRLVETTPETAAYIVRRPDDRLQTFQSSRWKQWTVSK